MLTPGLVLVVGVVVLLLTGLVWWACLLGNLAAQAVRAGRRRLRRAKPPADAVVFPDDPVGVPSAAVRP